MKAEDRRATAERIYGEGSAAFKAEEHERALGRFELLLSDFADVTYDPEIRMWIGACRYWLGDFEEALASLTLALDEADSTEDKCYLIQIYEYIARVHYALDDYDLALANIEHTEEYHYLWEEPDSWRYRSEFRLLKGRILLQLGRFGEALGEMETSKREIPRPNVSPFVESLYNYEQGRTHFYLGNIDEASRLLNSVDPSYLCDEALVTGYRYMSMRLGIDTKQHELVLHHWRELRAHGIPQTIAGEVYSMAGRALFYLGRGEASLHCFQVSMKSRPLSDEIKQGNKAFMKKLAKGGIR